VPKPAERYTNPAKLQAAVLSWATEKVAWATGALRELKAIGPIPGTDRRLEARAKQLHDELLAALNAADEFARATPRAPRGYVYLLEQLTSDLSPRGFDDLHSALHLLNQRAVSLAKSLTAPSDGWVALRHFVQEVGKPWPASDRPEGFRFEKGGDWRPSNDHELTLDELVALAVLAGHFDKARSSGLITQAKDRGGATVKDGVDVLRKPMRKHVQSLTRRSPK